MQHASPPADSLPPRPTGFVISNHFKASWSPLIHPRMSSRSKTFFHPPLRLISREYVWCNMAIRREVGEAQTSLDATVNSADTTTADLDEDWCSSTPAPPLSSFGVAEEEAPGSDERNCPLKLLRRVIWPPAASGSLFPARFRQSPRSNLMLSFSLLPAPDNEGKPYGAPSVLRRGKAGAPLLKGQKPDIALRSCGQAQMGQMTSPRQEPSIRRSLHVASPPLWCLCNSSDHFLQVSSHLSPSFA